MKIVHPIIFRSWWFKYGTVCYKYEILNQITGVQKQGIISFHEKIKFIIKNPNSVRTEELVVF